MCMLCPPVVDAFVCSPLNWILVGIAFQFYFIFLLLSTHPDSVHISGSSVQHYKNVDKRQTLKRSKGDYRIYNKGGDYLLQQGMAGPSDMMHHSDSERYRRIVGKSPQSDSILWLLLYNCVSVWWSWELSRPPCRLADHPSLANTNERCAFLGHPTYAWW